MFGYVPKVSPKQRGSFTRHWIAGYGLFSVVFLTEPGQLTSTYLSSRCNSGDWIKHSNSCYDSIVTLSRMGFDILIIL
jgi:hypothetical protein